MKKSVKKEVFHCDTDVSTDFSEKSKPKNPLLSMVSEIVYHCDTSVPLKVNGQFSIYHQ